MIRIVKGEPLSPEAFAFVERHPLAITGHVLRAVGLALVVGVLTAVIFAAILMPAVHTFVIAAGLSFAGIALLHQGTALVDRAIKAALNPIKHLSITHLRKGLP